MKSVILVIGQLPPPVHGTNVMTRRFMEALAVHGYSSALVDKRFSTSTQEVEKLMPKKILKIPSLFFRLIRAIQIFKPQLCVFFISVGWITLLIDSMLAFILLFRRVPYVLYFHGAGYRNYERHSNPLFKAIVRRVLQNASGGIVVGRNLKSDVNHCIPDDRLFVLPNGIPDIEKDKGFRKKAKENGRLNVLFLSNLVDFKGPLEFLKMAHAVTEKEKNVHFILAGKPADPAYYESLLHYIRENNLEEYLSLPGGVYGEEKENLFQAADIFVLPTFKDTFGMVNVEAMRWSLPVVSSDVGAISEIVIDGISGYIVHPGCISGFAEKVLTLMKNGNLRVKMGKEGRHRFEENYSLEAYNRNVKDALSFFLRRLLAGKISMKRRFGIDSPCAES
jgi:glycosyltransferase involved in cell wall biosynthesis